MIVVDTDVIANFWLPTTRSAAARGARRRDAQWAVPRLWRSEFCSVLRQYMLQSDLAYAEALWYATRAEHLMRRGEHEVSFETVLKLVEQTKHSSYDCEYVALARQLGVLLVTGDTDLASRFPDDAVLMEDFVAA